MTTLNGNDRAAWLEQRRQAIGGSDAAAVVGLDPWRGPIDVWLDKRGVDAPRAETPAMAWGSRLEDAIATHFGEAEGLPVHDLGPYAIVQSPFHPFMACTPDRLVDDPAGRVPLQIKTTSERMAERWENGPPDYVVAQVMHEIAVCHAPAAWVAVLIGGNDYRAFRLDHDPELIDIMVDFEMSFWQHVEAGTVPPTDGHPTAADAIARLYPESVPGRAVDLDDDVADALEALRDAKARAKEADDDCKRYQGIVTAALGEAEEGLVKGRVACTWRTVRSQRLDVKALREAEPELADAYTSRSSSRRFLIREG